METPPDWSWACLVYMVVAPEHRHTGVAKALYDACVERVKAQGIKHLYAWANDESDGSMIGFLEKHGFIKGHPVDAVLRAHDG